MLEVDMNNGRINIQSTEWASGTIAKVGESDASSEFKNKIIRLIVDYNDCRRDGLPHNSAVQELKTEKLEARVRMNEIKIQQNKLQLIYHSEFVETESESDSERVGLQL